MNYVCVGVALIFLVPIWAWAIRDWQLRQMVRKRDKMYTKYKALDRQISIYAGHSSALLWIAGAGTICLLSYLALVALGVI